MVCGGALVRELPQDWMINDEVGGGQIVLCGALKLEVFFWDGAQVTAGSCVADWG